MNESYEKVPEQVIAAILESEREKQLENLVRDACWLIMAVEESTSDGECENIAPDYLDFLCSACGFVHYHSDENDTGDGNDWAYCPRCGKAVKR